MGRAAFAAALYLTGCPAAEPAVTYGDGEPTVYGYAGTDAASGSGGAVAGASGDAGDGSPSAGAGGTAGTDQPTGDGGSSGGGVGSNIQELSFSVTTVTQGGRYAPRNIGAIWIETSSGEFVKSLKVWAKLRRRYLTNYNAAVGTTGSVDVSTSATLTSHKTHAVTWDVRDRDGATVPAGAYRLFVEVTEKDGTGMTYSLDFDTSAGIQTLSPSDATYFKGLSLSLD